MALLSIRVPLPPAFPIASLLSSTLCIALSILGFTIAWFLLRPARIATNSILVRSYLLSSCSTANRRFGFSTSADQKGHKVSLENVKMSDENVAQFCNISGAQPQLARKFIQRYKQLEMALNAYYNNPNEFQSSAPLSSAPSPNKLKTLFDKYAETSSTEPANNVISLEGTIRFCEDLDVNPEDPVLLALAYELKSKKLGEWNKQGWVDGWKSLGADSIDAMQTVIHQLAHKLGSDPSYFEKVYKQTFLIVVAMKEGTRSLVLDDAKDYWRLLISFGTEKGVISGGWDDEHTDWWFEFLSDKKKVKGVSKDTWNMFLDFIRSIDATFSNYDIEGAWPSVIDEFVEFAKSKLSK